MIRLIINADDYGDGPVASARIRQAHTAGIVTSTTALMSCPAVAEALTAALSECPGLGLGVHLRLTQGRPLLAPRDLRSLVLPDGAFPDYRDFLARVHSLDIGEVKSEWTAQIRKFVSITGRNPDHLDSHHHAACFTPSLFRAFLETAREYRCPIRLAFNPGVSDTENGLPEPLRKTMETEAPRLLREFGILRPDRILNSFYDEGATLGHLLELISSLPEGVTELVTHPGKIPGVDRQTSNDELAVLTEPAVAEKIRLRAVRLIPFGELRLSREED